MNAFLDFFNDPATAPRYAEGPPRFTPGFGDMQTTTAILLAERAGPEAEVLVLGAGGGLELAAFAALFPGWRFVAVDPAGPMLAQAREVMGEAAARARFVEGLIEDAPAGPFAAGCCLLTLHFLESGERLETLRAVRRRLAPGAPFVAVHCSFPQAEPDRTTWLDRYEAFALVQGVDAQLAAKARAVTTSLPVLDPAEDEALLREAGFGDVNLFYAGFGWRGWVGYA
jgi:tRNA (cmo5U34)-methyltransferase